MNPSPFISFPIFENFVELVCAFSTRQGGVSHKPFDSLNLGMRTGDKLENVQKNRRIFFNALDINADKIAYTDQVHSAHVKLVQKATLYKRTDALVFSGRDIFLTVLTADCFPIFIYAPRFDTIAIIHAGWRGVVNGIIENTLEKIRTYFKINPMYYLVAIGPGMQSECFEVKEDVYRNIPDRFIYPHISPEHKYLDLHALILEKLLFRGVLRENIYSSELCTKCESHLFYSYRRDGLQSGRMMGIIGLRK